MPSTKHSLLLLLIFLPPSSSLSSSPPSDLPALLLLKSFLLQTTTPLFNNSRKIYLNWTNEQHPSSFCHWNGVSCNPSGRLTSLSLSHTSISGPLFPNFSSFPSLLHLDLSLNSLSGPLPPPLSPPSLLSLNLSFNRFSGPLLFFSSPHSLKSLDLTSNAFSGPLPPAFPTLYKFSAPDNTLSGPIPRFTATCRLRLLDLSENMLTGEVPEEICGCGELRVLYLWGNRLTGRLPGGLGGLRSLKVLSLGNNSFSRSLPYSLVECRGLTFLDLSFNGFSGEVQPIFGELTRVRSLLLQGNGYTSGLNRSGILELRRISRLDLSFNGFSGPLPSGVSRMRGLTFLSLAGNMFSGGIPPEYGELAGIRAMDLSSNRLSGRIPAEFGRLGSLLWLMLADNRLSGSIPPEVGGCGSLLWVNLANNRLTGGFPAELTLVGGGAWSTFVGNRMDSSFSPDSGDCATVRRWIPASYRPFDFAYTTLTRRRCGAILNQLFKGYAVFPACGGPATGPGPGPGRRFSGYLQLSGNRLAGELPEEISRMENFGLIHLGGNRLRGRVPAGIGNLPLFVLNISDNGFSGEIPPELGGLRCLQTLDLSVNNFSGEFPWSLRGLTDMTRFNVSYNPLLTGSVPAEGQLTTFDADSFLGNPLLRLPPFINASSSSSSLGHGLGRAPPRGGPVTLTAVVVFVVIAVTISLCGAFFYLVAKTAGESSQGRLFDEGSTVPTAAGSGASSPWLSDAVKVIRLDRTAFTRRDIIEATGNFSDDRILGAGGFGTVYRGVLPDGREVAIKKLQREGVEAEKEFRAEMEVLAGAGGSGSGSGWPHPNLVTLYGWCLDGREKLLVYEYMQGGSLEEVVLDPERLTARGRVEVARDVARALSFLHHHCFPAVVHRDVKAGNVLLDKQGRARVTDFGLARAVRDGHSHVSTVVAGTVGYVPPEYGQTWRASPKGDVYSFGVLLMELATCRSALPPFDHDECLVDWVRRVPLARGSAALEPVWGARGAADMWPLLLVGIRCAVDLPHARPTMLAVLEMLDDITVAPP